MNLLDLFVKGGWVMYPILACSVLSWAVIAERCWYYWRTRTAGRPESDAPRFALLRDTAASLNGASPDAADRLLRAAADPFLRADDRGLALLGAVAVLSPLLGLFGTVVGMIEMFRSLAESGVRPEFSSLVGGIWTALLTTAFGLMAAIPAQAAHHAFDHAAERRARVLQEYSGRLGHGS